MNCDQIRPLMSLYISGDLDERETGMIDKHLETCPRCRDLEKQSREVMELLAKDRLDDPGPAFWERFESSVLEGTRRHDAQMSQPARSRLKGLLVKMHSVTPVRALTCVSTAVLVIALSVLFVWKAQLRYDEPLTDYFSNLDSIAVFPPADDLLESSSSRSTYDIFSEIEEMDSEELELFAEALEDWRESS